MNYIVDSTDLTSVANAIRTKGGTSASLAFPADFVSAIQAIPTGGGGASYETKELTLTSKATSTVTIAHTLGRKPKFVAIAIKENETLASGEDRYRIALLLANIGIGASDFNTSTASSAFGKPRVFSLVNNNSAMYIGQQGSNLLDADASNVYVYYQSTSAGHLGATTYEVIIG